MFLSLTLIVIYQSNGVETIIDRQLTCSNDDYILDKQEFMFSYDLNNFYISVFLSFKCSTMKECYSLKDVLDLNYMATSSVFSGFTTNESFTTQWYNFIQFQLVINNHNANTRINSGLSFKKIHSDLRWANSVIENLDGEYYVSSKIPELILENYVSSNINITYINDVLNSNFISIYSEGSCSKIFMRVVSLWNQVNYIIFTLFSYVAILIVIFQIIKICCESMASNKEDDTKEMSYFHRPLLTEQISDFELKSVNN